MDILNMLAGASVFLAGFVLGRMHRPRQEPKKVDPVCGCKHSLAYHDPKTGKCHGWHKMVGYEPDQCTCRRYAGPQPITELYAPEITE